MVIFSANIYFNFKCKIDCAEYLIRFPLFYVGFREGGLLVQIRRLELDSIKIWESDKFPSIESLWVISLNILK